MRVENNLDTTREGPDRGELNLANLISLSRPFLMALATRYGLEKPRLYGIFVCAAFATDIADGMVARSLGTSKWGGLIDVICDHIAEFILYSDLSKQKVIPSWIPTVILGTALIKDVARYKRVRNNSGSEPDIVASRASKFSYNLAKLAVPATAVLRRDRTPWVAAGVSAIAALRVFPTLYSNREKKR